MESGARDWNRRPDMGQGSGQELNAIFSPEEQSPASPASSAESGGDAQDMALLALMNTAAAANEQSPEVSSVMTFFWRSRS